MNIELSTKGLLELFPTFELKVLTATPKEESYKMQLLLFNLKSELLRDNMLMVQKYYIEILGELNKHRIRLVL